MSDRKLAIFDWNGTLIADTKIAWVASNACLEFYGVPPITLKKQRETFDFPIIHYYKRNGCDIDRVLQTRTQANEIFQGLYEKMAANVRTRRGARELLGWLNASGFTCIILSNYLSVKIEPQLERLQLKQFFSYVSANNCDGTTILSATNKLERLSEFMVKRGYSPNNAFIIGDSMEEPDIGRKLGISSIGITGGCISEGRLRRASPDYTVNALPEVRAIVEAMWP